MQAEQADGATTADPSPLGSLASDVGSVLGFPLVETSNLTITVGHTLLAVVVVGAVWVSSKLLRRAARRYASRHAEVNRASLFTVTRLLNYGLIAVGLVLFLDALGIPLGRLFVFAGALGVGLGFGLQAIFNNFLGGVILLFDRSLKVGEFVDLGEGLEGTVKAINIRFTRVTTNDGIDVLVPNSDFVTKRVVNWTYGSEPCRLHIPFGVAYGTEKTLVEAAAKAAAKSLRYTVQGDPSHATQLWLVAFGDSSVDYELIVWVNDEGKRHQPRVTAEYLWALDSELAARGIVIPFPQRDLRIVAMPDTGAVAKPLPADE